MANTILTMWQEALARLVIPLTQWYNGLTVPVALLMGVPAVLLLLSKIINVLGGTTK